MKGNTLENIIRGIFDVTKDDIHLYLHAYRGYSPFHLFEEPDRWRKAAALCGREAVPGTWVIDEKTGKKWMRGNDTDRTDEGYILLTPEQRVLAESYQDKLQKLGFALIDLPWCGDIDVYRRYLFCPTGLSILAKVPRSPLTDDQMLQIVRYCTMERAREKQYQELTRIQGPAWVVTGLYWFNAEYNLMSTTQYVAHTLNLRVIRFNPSGSLTTVGDHTLLLF